MSPDSLSFVKLVVMSSALQNLRKMPDSRPKIHSFNQRCPIQSQLQSVLGAHSFCVKHNYLLQMLISVPCINKGWLVVVIVVIVKLMLKGVQGKSHQLRLHLHFPSSWSCFVLVSYVLNLPKIVPQKDY